MRVRSATPSSKASTIPMEINTSISDVSCAKLKRGRPSQTSPALTSESSISSTSARSKADAGARSVSGSSGIMTTIDWLPPW